MKRTFALLCLVPTLLAADASVAFAKKKSNKASVNSAVDFLRPPRLTKVSMSPNGKYVAGIAPIDKMDGDWGLVVFDLDTMKLKKSFSWKKEHDIYRYNWVNNERIIFNVSKWGSFTHGVYGIDLNKRRAVPIIKDDAAVTMVDPNTDSENEAWIWIRDALDMKPCLAKLDKMRTGTYQDAALTRVFKTVNSPLISDRIPEPPSEVLGWYIDNAHEPRIVLRFYEDKLEYLHREEDDKDWSPLALDPEEWSVHAFSADNRQIFISGYDGSDTEGLYLYSFDDETISDALFRDEFYDFSETASFLKHKGHLLGMRYDRDVPAILWFSSDMEKIQQMVDGALPGKVNVIDDWSDDFSRFLVISYSDTVPPEYLLLNIKENRLRSISKSAPWLDNSSLAKTEVFRFETEDGLRLEGYLTRPTEGSAPYPTICLVHGGPWSRDYGTFDEESQFFASRGYAVIKINYRGSQGYGKAISWDERFAFRKMHDDVTAGVKMAVKAGIADPDRLAIMGASFGGYAAMCGAAFEGDFYRCAITNMGVFNWEEMIKDRKRQEYKYTYFKLRQELGPEKGNQKLFEEISPIYHIDKVQIPVLVIHGKKDKNVSIRQSKELVSELKAHDVVFDTHFVGGEGHNIFKVDKRVETYEKVLAFLERHMN